MVWRITLKNMVLSERYVSWNRSERDTTGCISDCKSGLAQSLYQQQMDENTFEKWYMATVEGIVEADEDSLGIIYGT